MAKITTITSQIDDGSTALTEFSSVQEAKDWFYTAQAQQCSEDRWFWTSLQQRENTTD